MDLILLLVFPAQILDGKRSMPGFKMLFPSLCKSRRFAIEAKTGFNFSTTVYGKEEIDGVVYDLKDLDGYKGVTTQALFGLEVSFMLLKLLILLCHTLI
jgi:hypothetical protein